MPADPAGYIPSLFRHRYFETISITREDSLRQRYYAQNAERQALESASTDLDEFLTSLEMKGRIEPVTTINIERTTQLVNKSNQFNLTGKRRSIAEVRDIATSPDWIALSISLRDKLGDHGLISVLFLHRHGDCLEIDTWVMSCRVLQRGVEWIALDAAIGCAKAANVTKLIGDYVATERNGLVRNHYRSLGFALAGSDNGKTRWVFTVPDDHSRFTTPIQLEA